MTYRYSIQKHNGLWCVIEEGYTRDYKQYAIIWKHKSKPLVKEFAKDMAEQPHVHFVSGEFIIPSNYEFK